MAGLPIFCDSGFIVLSGLNKSLAGLGHHRADATCCTPLHVPDVRTQGSRQRRTRDATSSCRRAVAVPTLVGYPGSRGPLQVGMEARGTGRHLLRHRGCRALGLAIGTGEKARRTSRGRQEGVRLDGLVSRAVCGAGMPPAGGLPSDRTRRNLVQPAAHGRWLVQLPVAFDLNLEVARHRGHTYALVF